MRLARRATRASRGQSITSVTRRLTCTVAGPEMVMPSPRLRLILRFGIGVFLKWGNARPLACARGSLLPKKGVWNLGIAVG